MIKDSRSNYQRRLGLWLLLPAALPLLVLGVLFLNLERNRVVERETANVAQSARTVAVHMGQYLGSQLAAVQQAASTLSWHPDCRDFACAAQHLEALRRAFPALHTAIATRPDGTIYSASSDMGAALNQQLGDGSMSVADRSYFIEPRRSGRGYISPVFAGRGFAAVNIVGVSHPVVNANGDFDGIVEGSLDLNAVLAAVQPLMERDHNQHFEIRDGSGAVIFSYSSADLPELPADGDGWLSFAIEVPVAAWRVQSSTPLRRVYQPVYRDATLLSLLLALLLASEWWATRWITRRIGRPLAELAAQLDRSDVASGQLALRSDSSASESLEVSSIRRALEALADRLADTHQQREEVEEQLTSTLLERDNYINAQTERLREALNKAQSAVRARDELIANTSHEMRTPLTAVINGLELLSEQVAEPMIRARVSSMLRSAEGLLSLINDMLDLARLETGHLELDSNPFNPFTEGRRIIETMEPVAVERDLRLRFVFDDECSQICLGDPQRVRQLLLNLLGNALKFTPAGGLVSLNLKRLNEQTLRFVVSDTGIGIDPADQARIFEPFVQVESQASRRFEGTGLGLAICLRLVQLMNGQVRLSSELHRGSRFVVDLPMPLTDLPEAALNDSGAELSAAARSLQVLVVDDVDVNRDLLREQIELLGVRAEVAPSGRVALQRLQEGDFDVVFMDCQMPDMDGYQTTKAARELKLRKTPFIVAVTASARPEDRERCLRSGMDDYRAKPLRRNDLIGLLNSIAVRPGVG